MYEGKVLMIDEEKGLRELARSYLERNGYSVLATASGEHALQIFREQNPDVIILDVILPDADGVELCKRFRQDSQVPIIFVSRIRETGVVLKSMESGGDDYLVKPVDPNILLERIKANMRRIAKGRQEDFPREEPNYTWQYKGLEINFNTFSVTVDGKSVILHTKELQLLLFFVRNPNEVFGLRQLLDQVWGKGLIRDERTVMLHISNLRRKIEADSAHPQFIRTVRGFGYILQLD